MIEFEGFPKIARLNREIIVTEKLDGTNAQVVITEDGGVFAGSRNRWITTDEDNYGFAAWVELHKENLLLLGPGRHFGEWWGAGIQRRYGQSEKNFSLFRAPNIFPESARVDPAMYRGDFSEAGIASALSRLPAWPLCCRVVPVLYRGAFSETEIINALGRLAEDGSVAAPGFKPAEGIVVYHVAARTSFKVTLENDEQPKGKTVCAD